MPSQSLLDPQATPVPTLDRRRSGRRITDLPKLAVVIPALNEGATIASVIAGVPRHIIGIQRVEVILVDDGSSDDTQDQARTGGVDVIVAHPHRRGLVAAFKLGVNEALRRGADIVVNLDGDGQHDPTCIPKMLGPIVEQSADIVLGVRPLGDAKDEMSPVRRYGNQVGSWVTGKALGLELNVGLRAVGAELRDEAPMPVGKNRSGDKSRIPRLVHSGSLGASAMETSHETHSNRSTGHRSRHGVGFGPGQEHEETGG